VIVVFGVCEKIKKNVCGGGGGGGGRIGD